MSSAAQPSNRNFYLLVAGFLLAAVLTGLLSARRGKSSVEQWKDEMRAKGERFTITELLQGSRPAKTNRVNELVRLGKLLGIQNTALAGLTHCELLPNGHANATWTRTKLGATSGIGRTRGSLVPTAIDPYEWENLADDLALAEPVLAEVRALLPVPDRDVGWDYDHRTSQPRSFVEKRAVAQWLAAAHTHHLHEGKWAEADVDLSALLDLVAWHEEDFTVVSQMIRAAMGGLAADCTWSALQAPEVTDAQLAAYQRRWEKLVVLTSFNRAMEFERAGMDSLLLELRRGTSSYASVMGTGSAGAAKFGDEAIAILWRAVAAEGDELFYLRHLQEQLDALRRLARGRAWVEVVPLLDTNSAATAVFSTWRGKLLWFSGMATPNFRRAYNNVLRYEAHRELIITALALERFRRRYGRHPAALAELAPALLPAVPVDWMAGKPLRYRLNADGTFTLWSIGEDFKDDGGDPTSVSSGSRQNPFWERRDVVWPRPPP